MNNPDQSAEQLKTELEELKQALELLKQANKKDSLTLTQAFNALQENEMLYRNLYLNAPLNYQLLDAKYCFIDVNPNWLNTFGYSSNEVIGHQFSEFMTPESAKLVLKQFPELKKSGESHDLIFEMIRNDGTRMFVNFDGKTELDEKGNLKQIHCTLTDITKRIIAEEAIDIKNQAIESTINAIAISDLQGNLTYVNHAFCKLLGYCSADEVLGKPVAGYWHADEISAKAMDVIQKKGCWTGELVAQNKDGKTFEVQISARMVKDTEGRPISMITSFADISRWKQAEMIQAENEISYRELFNNVTDAIYIQNEEGAFLDVNEGAVKMYGYPREVLVGKNPLFVSAPGKNDLAALAEILDHAYAGEPQQFEFWGKRSSGEIFPKEVRAFTGTYFGQKVIIAMAQDITGRKQAETKLLESERRYRELIELAVDGIMIGSQDGTILGANTYMLNLTGRSLENLVGLNISEIFTPDVLKKVPFRYDLLKKGETVFSERNILRPDGRIIPIEMHTKMMPDGTYQSIYRNVTDRKKTEETLRQSEEKYKSLVESTSDIIWETDIDGLYTYVSPQFESILGYPPDKTIGKSPYDFISDDLLSEISARAQSTEESVHPFYLLVNKFKHRDGHKVYFETSGVPIHDFQGKLTGYRGVSRDISKRHLAEKELHKLSLVVHQSPNTIIITDLDGKMEYINPAGCTTTGYRFDELIGKNPAIFGSGETSKATYKSLWSTIKSGNEWKGIFLNKKKNGELFWESAFILPVRDTEGTITNYLGIKEDITIRKQAEVDLKESEERYRELFEASPDAIILADIETGMLIDANTAACRLLDRELDEIRQMHQTMIHPDRFKEFSAELFQEDIEKQNTIENQQAVESIILRSDGSEIPVEVVSNKITIKDRQILQGVFRNITERKQAQEELMKAKEKAEASDKLKSAFLQNISHELRTPLNGIIGFSDMITQMDSSEEDRIEFSKMIKKSSSRLINTITSYMDISMIVSGITEITKSPFSLTQFMNKINDQTIETCNSRNLTLKIIKNAPVEDIQITTDENLLTKVFSHLIDNAIKFTNKGSVTIGHELKDGYHQFSVSDTGTGIPEDSLSVVFEVFMQADLSTSRNYEGSGLGLSIARGFIKLLEGDIWVESEDGEGSTFIFTVPDKATSKLISKETNKSYGLTQPSEMIILVAEDDDSNYKYIEIVLKKAAFKVLRAKNGFEAVDICRNQKGINVLLTDLKMPGMDGFEAIRKVRKLLPELPIIALSGFASSGDENEARVAGCNEYIIKPVSKVKLLESINRILQTQGS
jgi:PAS domain S-box-containing protein